MLIAIAAAAATALVVALGRVWMDLSKQSDQLSTTIEAYRRLADERRAELARAQARSQEARRQIQALVKDCSEIEATVRRRVETLRDQQERLERLRPQARQVDKDEEDGDFLWRKH